MTSSLELCYRMAGGEEGGRCRVSGGEDGGSEGGRCRVCELTVGGQKGHTELPLHRAKVRKCSFCNYTNLLRL